MNIVWYSWKDMSHPEAGGAEVVSTALRKRLVQSGHKVLLVTSRPKGAHEHDNTDDVITIRSGGRFSVYWRAYRERKKVSGIFKQVDVVVDEMNTLPFFAGSYMKARQKKVLLTYQLARKVWFFQMPFPLNYMGYIIEPLYLRLAARSYRQVITESQSTVDDLRRNGFKHNRINTFHVAINTKPIKKLERKTGKHILFFGALRPMKRPLDAVKAFEHAHDQDPSLTLDLAGNDVGAYAEKVRTYIENSRCRDAITLHGRVSKEAKIDLMKRASVQLVTSVKEGWGLIASEANSQGTPVVAYDVDGVRDSVIDAKTGLLAKDGDTEALGNLVLKMLSDKEGYEALRRTAWEFSKTLTNDTMYKEFMNALLDEKQ